MRRALVSRSVVPMSRLGVVADVLEHRFGAGKPFTVGVEEEYMLLDRESLDLAQGVEKLLSAERGSTFAELVAPELFESLVEFHTPVCATVADAERQLRAMRAHAVASATANGLAVGSAGTHPFGLFESQHLTNRDRYRAIVDDLQYAARRELIFGLHVHVAVDDADLAIRVVNALQPHLCELVALSASSPFWRGRETGFASCRPLIFSAFPRSGPSPMFRDYAEYAAAVRRLTASGCIEDYTRIWWDVRPHPRFGTVEVRMMDAVTRVEDAVALTAYVQCLVAEIVRRDREGAAPARLHPALAQENRWQAARHGLEARIIDPAGGAPVALRDLVERSLASIAPAAEELGCAGQLAGVGRILRDGNGAARQRAIQTATGDLAEVVRDVVQLTTAA
jgi:glutamate---cysteine ligase / carboxylate-amine ligase